MMDSYSQKKSSKRALLKLIRIINSTDRPLREQLDIYIGRDREKEKRKRVIIFG